MGFSYDLTGDERHVVFGGAGRAYDRNLFDLLQKEANNAALSEPTVQFLNPDAPPGAGCVPGNLSKTCVPWDPIYLTSAGLQSLGSGQGEVDLINNHLKAPYSDQFSVGIRNKLGDWNTSVTIAQINSYNGLVGQWGNHYGDGGWYEGGVWGSSGVPGIGSLILWDNGKKTRNTQLLLSAIKPYTKESGWGSSFAYTYSHATQNMNYVNYYEFDYQSIKNIPMFDSNAVPKHRLVMTGNVDTLWGITLGAKLTLETVWPYFAADGCANTVCSQNPNFPGPYTYLAQYLKGEQFLFGGPIFGYRDIDVQASKNFNLPRGSVLQVRLDVLNVFNFKNFDSSQPNDYWPAPAEFNKTGPIIGVTRTGKLSIDYKF